MSKPKYSPQVIEFIKENANNGYEFLIEELEKQYDLKLTKKMLIGIKSKHKIDIQSKYTPEIIDFIRENAIKGNVWLRNEINKKWNMNVTYLALNSIACKNHIRIKQYNKKGFNGYVYEIVIENYNKYSYEELANLINKKLNIQLTRNQVKAFCHSLGLKNYDKDKFRILKDKLPIGSEKIQGNKNPCVYIKYRNLPSSRKQNEYKINWKPKARYIWEQHYGEIPKGHYIIHLDGDYRNCDINNLKLVSQYAMTKITTSKSYGKGIITEALCEILDLEEKLKEELL